MSLILTKEEIYEIISKKNICFKKETLLFILNKTNKNCKSIISFINFNVLKNNKHVNPLLWQFGHVIFFYINLILKNLPNFKNLNNNPYKDYVINNNYIDFYDSHKTPLENRIGEFLLNYDTCVNLYDTIIVDLTNYININKITNIETYLIMLGLLHNEMHNEAFIFTNLYQTNLINYSLNNLNNLNSLNSLNNSNNSNNLNNLNSLNSLNNSNNSNNLNNLIKEIEFVNYKDGIFNQGCNNSEKYLIFDNEMPQFTKKISNFKISKYPITEYQYLQFILDNGYGNESLWCRNGSIWKNKNNISLPLYWIKKENKYYKKLNNKTYSVNTNLPITNISYYEAQAYCKWKNVRLPTESEYEYVSTNKGNTIFPWGDEDIDDDKCNLNYSNYIVEVNKYTKGNNYENISQLIGNIWEWCEEQIYPYDGFKIDPVYREMSYPFFGYKKICKGGCFAVPDYLIHPKYRNAQYPDCRIQFIGFRVCK